MPMNFPARAAAIGGLAIGIGWLFAVGTAGAETVTQSNPAEIHYAAFDCPLGNGAFGGIEYVPDPYDSNAFYVCSGGLPQQHLKCRRNTVLNMTTTPPTCDQWRAPYRP